MALFEKGGAGAHHLLIVSGLPARVDEQIDIALPGHIEAVPVSASECLSFSFQLSMAVGTAQHKHLPLFPLRPL